MHVRRILGAAAAPAAGCRRHLGRAAHGRLTERHDGGGQFNDDGWCAVTDPLGHLVVAGESADGIGGVDLCVRKLDRLDGHQIWQARYVGYDAKDVTVADITWDLAGRLLVAGFIRGCVG